MFKLGKNISEVDMKRDKLIGEGNSFQVGHSPFYGRCDYFLDGLVCTTSDGRDEVRT